MAIETNQNRLDRTTVRNAENREGKREGKHECLLERG